MLLMLCPNFRDTHPGDSPAAKQMAKASWNWVELLAGLLLWQYRDLPFYKLKLMVEEAVSWMEQRTRHTDRDYLDFFNKVGTSAWQSSINQRPVWGDCLCFN